MIYLALSVRLGRNYISIYVYVFGVSFHTSFFFFFFMRFSSRGQLTLFTYCSFTVHETYNHFIEKKNIKNGSYGTIHTFKNYFVTVFLVFNKISCIQMDHESP